jgi:hypothetical protein
MTISSVTPSAPSLEAIGRQPPSRQPWMAFHIFLLSPFGRAVQPIFPLTGRDFVRSCQTTPYWQKMSVLTVGKPPVTTITMHNDSHVAMRGRVG